MPQRKAYLAFLFAFVTLVYSSAIALILHRHPWATVHSDDIMNFGAINGTSLKNFEIWRIFVSQLIHSKQGHMIFNITLVFVLGSAVERIIGRFRFALLYWISGSLGIVASVLFLPEYVSSGASQALCGLGAGVLVLNWQRQKISKVILIIAYIALGFSLVLDLIFAHYPKPGHVVGFITGALLTYGFMELERKKSEASINF
jgi:rhomboid protease GluP